MQLRIRRVSQGSLGLTLPQPLIVELGWEEGDTLYAVRTPDGVEISRLDPDFEEALETSKRATRRYANAMKSLAEK